MKTQDALSYGCLSRQLGLCQVKGGKTDLITLKNAITFYLIVFLGVVGMGCCG